MKYSNLIFNWLNKIVHRFERNLRSRFEIIILSKSQFAKFNRSSMTVAQSEIFQVFFFEIAIILLLNLQMILMKTFKSICDSDNVNTKSNVKIWNDIEDESIDCRLSKDLCRRVRLTLHFATFTTKSFLQSFVALKNDVSNLKQLIYQWKYS